MQSARPFGAIAQGLTNSPGPQLLTGGRSLHPLQRMGEASHSGFPSLGVAPPPNNVPGTPYSTFSMGEGPPMAGLINPPILNPSVVSATRAVQVRV